ncbi:MAG: hypothetical protein AB1505_03995 [Candidatus Latescibacterota bacterium]
MRPAWALVGLLLLGGWPGIAWGQAGDTLSPARAPADTLTAPEPGAAPRTTADSLAARQVDSTRVWKTWKPLWRAIALGPLDGPEDILEKAEIIQDRIDDLVGERRRLAALAGEQDERGQALLLQVEVLEDLDRIQRGGDLQRLQRLASLRDEADQATRRLRALGRSLAELDGEIGRLRRLVEHYARLAEDLRRREEGD